MQTILQLLFDADIGFDDMPLNQDPEYKKFLQILSENNNKLIEGLSKEQKTLLDTSFHADGELNEKIAFRKFSHGFLLGSLLMLEIMEGKEDVFK